MPVLKKLNIAVYTFENSLEMSMCSVLLCCVQGRPNESALLGPIQVLSVLQSGYKPKQGDPLQLHFFRV